ncbi:MAG: hypothetical protein AABX80_00775 [Nanoarchaeota archaeon]
MNGLKRLFSKKKDSVKIFELDDLDNLICALGKSKEFVKSLYSSNPKSKGYKHLAEGELSILELKKGILFRLNVTDYFSQHPTITFDASKFQPYKKYTIAKTISYGEVEKYPILKHYL